MTDSPHRGLSTKPEPGTGARTPRPLQADHIGAATRSSPAFQHAPRGVDVQDLRPLRGRPCGPILDPDAYPGAPNSQTKRVKNEEHGVDRPRPYRDDLRAVPLLTTGIAA
jgi:hypothetical protein